MSARLVSYSQPPPNSSNREPQPLHELVAYCARVSNPTNQNNTKTSQKLVEYLIQHQHWSPLEMVSICLEIETTRDIGRQILRHRSFSFQEFSQRYAIADCSFMAKEARLQDHKNRQNSIPTDDVDLEAQWNQKQMDLANQVKHTYQWALENGIAKEQARAVLPEGMTPSKLYMNGTLRSWLHYIQLRTKMDTQKEHREVALACAKAISEIYPIEYSE